MKKLTRDERCEISALEKAGKTPSKIAKQLKRSISTITRELSRNSTQGGLKIQMQHKKIYDIKIDNLSREKYVATYEHRRAY